MQWYSTQGIATTSLSALVAHTLSPPYTAIDIALFLLLTNPARNLIIDCHNSAGPTPPSSLLSSLSTQSPSTSVPN